MSFNIRFAWTLTVIGLLCVFDVVLCWVLFAPYVGPR